MRAPFQLDRDQHAEHSSVAGSSVSATTITAMSGGGKRRDRAGRPMSWCID
jgi:hypothetical protein